MICIKKCGLVILLTSIIYIVILDFLSNNNQVSKVEYIPKYQELYNELKNDYELMQEYYSFTPAEIINISFNKLNNIFLINKGLEDGISEKSFVVNNEGLVGEVVKTFKNYSVIRLIYSSKTKVAIETNDCYGTLNVKNKNMIINDLINCENVKTGDPVFTSKYNYSSSNILIGYISKVLNGTIYIKSVINPYKLKYVGVIND
ncbi:MAG: rod shape-determining protein MreC [Bacilli bacterium]|nr:rod shape-determining protein MreC [Bacilli bacterium]